MDWIRLVAEQHTWFLPAVISGLTASIFGLVWAGLKGLFGGGENREYVKEEGRYVLTEKGKVNEPSGPKKPLVYQPTTPRPREKRTELELRPEPLLPKFDIPPGTHQQDFQDELELVERQLKSELFRDIREALDRPAVETFPELNQLSSSPPYYPLSGSAPSKEIKRHPVFYPEEDWVFDRVRCDNCGTDIPFPVDQPKPEKCERCGEELK